MRFQDMGDTILRVGEHGNNGTSSAKKFEACGETLDRTRPDCGTLQTAASVLRQPSE
jgi:hypothetical protein